MLLREHFTPMDSGVSSTQKVGGYFGANINVGAKTPGVCKEQFRLID